MKFKENFFFSLLVILFLFDIFLFYLIYKKYKALETVYYSYNELVIKSNILSYKLSDITGQDFILFDIVKIKTNKVFIFILFFFLIASLFMIIVNYIKKKPYEN